MESFPIKKLQSDITPWVFSLSQYVQDVMKKEIEKHLHSEEQDKKLVIYTTTHLYPLDTKLIYTINNELTEVESAFYQSLIEILR